MNSHKTIRKRILLLSNNVLTKQTLKKRKENDSFNNIFLFLFLSLSIPSLFKFKQTCRVVIVKQVCLPVNDNEQKVVHHLDHVERHQVQMHDTIKLHQKHPKDILEKQNALEVPLVIHHQNQMHQRNKNPRPKNHHHQFVKEIQKEKLQCLSAMQKIYKHHRQMMPKDKIYLLVVSP